MLTKEYAEKLEILRICRDDDAPKKGSEYNGLILAQDSRRDLSKTKLFCFGFEENGSCLVGAKDMSLFVFLRDGFAEKNGFVFAVTQGGYVSFNRPMTAADLEAELARCDHSRSFVSAMANQAKRDCIRKILGVLKREE